MTAVDQVVAEGTSAAAAARANNKRCTDLKSDPAWGSPAVVPPAFARWLVATTVGASKLRYGVREQETYMGYH